MNYIYIVILGILVIGIFIFFMIRSRKDEKNMTDKELQDKTDEYLKLDKKDRNNPGTCVTQPDKELENIVNLLLKNKKRIKDKQVLRKLEEFSKFKKCASYCDLSTSKINNEQGLCVCTTGYVHDPQITDRFQCIINCDPPCKPQETCTKSGCVYSNEADEADEHMNTLRSISRQYQQRDLPSRCLSSDEMKSMNNALEKMYQLSIKEDPIWTPIWKKVYEQEYMNLASIGARQCDTDFCISYSSKWSPEKNKCECTTELVDNIPYKYFPYHGRVGCYFTRTDWEGHIIGGLKAFRNYSSGINAIVLTKPTAEPGISRGLAWVGADGEIIMLQGGGSVITGLEPNQLLVPLYNLDGKLIEPGSEEENKIKKSLEANNNIRVYALDITLP